MEPNKGISIEIAERMLSRVDLENVVFKVVRKDNFQKLLKKFEIFEAYNVPPTLTPLQLIRIALGKYQIKQAESYYAQHLKKCNGGFITFALPDALCRTVFHSYYTDTCHPILLLLQLDSRFRSQKHYDAFVLVNRNGADENVILGYSCECYNGLRTVGCCSHVMCLIWYSFYAKNMMSPNPAGFLDEYFDHFNDAGEDSDEDEA